MTHNLDSSLGLVMDKLSQLNIDNNTYIIYLSDNGSVPNIPQQDLTKKVTIIL